MSENNGFKDLFFNRIFSLRNLFFIGNFLVLILFVYAVAQDFLREWKPYQARYYKMEKERIEGMMGQGDDTAKAALKDELKAARSRSVEVKQILINDLNRVDRCVTCHSGYDSVLNPTLTNGYSEHPYAAPANEIHKMHPPEKYGCTVCHEGQGLATTFVGAAHMPKSPDRKSVV